ncbi:MAG: hypothetical protein K2X81_27385 [Candidatus Obscuribacterales bacterium]|nr:hypothetical protein [Candidatus Obscuribacterales bacterium]
MAFNIRETYWGLKHLRLGFLRRLSKIQADAFLKQYEGQGVEIEACRDQANQEICCKRCGYLMMRARFETGWFLEICSAMPIVKLNNPAFKDWLTSLAKSPVPIPSAAGGAILHD